MKEKIEAARDAVADVLDMGEIGVEKYIELQKVYFRLEFMRRAREPGLKYGNFAPSNHAITHDGGHFVDFGGFKVPDTTNPFIDHAVTVDHLVYADGSVEVNVNGLDIDEVGIERGSHIP